MLGVNAKVYPSYDEYYQWGSHADNSVDLQEFMIMPAGAYSFSCVADGLKFFIRLRKYWQQRDTARRWR